MMHPQPLIALSDVEAGSQWFQRVLGLSSGHGGREYEMLMDGDDMVVQLHDWEADEHAHLGSFDNPSRGNGVLFWFATDDLDSVLQRVNENDAVVLDGPLLNPNSGLREVWLRGPECYVVVVAGPE
jgi:predicted enzyme related to lactoylglutathione lyase